MHNAQHVVIEPISIHTGVIISGVDLTRPLNNTEISFIRQALLDWKVVFLRDQHLTHQQHIDFAQCFVDLTPAHVIFGTDSEYPEIYPVTKNRTAFAARPLSSLRAVHRLKPAEDNDQADEYNKN